MPPRPALSLPSIVQLPNPDIPEPDRLSFRLQGDVSERQLKRRAGGQQSLCVRVPRIELWMLVAQHLGAIDSLA